MKSKLVGAVSAVLIAGAATSACADRGSRYDANDRWSNSAYGYSQYDRRPAARYDHRGRVVVERTVTVERPVYVERRVVRRPVREVIVERPVYVERAPVYHAPQPYGYSTGRAVVSPGTVGGAVVGAIIGSQVGHGGNRAATTAAGAVIGGVIGSQF